jgi:hypothetical protein
MDTFMTVVTVIANLLLPIGVIGAFASLAMGIGVLATRCYPNRDHRRPAGVEYPACTAVCVPRVSGPHRRGSRRPAARRQMAVQQGWAHLPSATSSPLRPSRRANTPLPRRGVKQDKGMSHLGHGDIPRPHLTAESVAHSRSPRYPTRRLHSPLWAAGSGSMGSSRWR